MLSAFIIKTSNSRFIGGIYAGALTFITGLYPTNHFQEVPIIWLIFLIVISLIASIVSCIFQKSDLLFINSLRACVNKDYSQYTGSSTYYYAAYTCQATTTVSCMCVDSSNTCFKYDGLPTQQCSYLVSRLPSQISVSYIIAMVSSIVSGIYLILCTIAFFYPSLLSIWLFCIIFQRNKETERQRRLESEHHHTHSHGHHDNHDHGNERGHRDSYSDGYNRRGADADHRSAASPSPDSSLVQESSHRYKGQVDPATGYKQGFGMFTYDNGDVYEGNFMSNKKHGMGCYTYKSGDVYTGCFQAGAKHGYGRYAFTSGDVYEGHYHNGVIHGRGRYTYVDGAYYEGSFDMGAKSGYGVHAFVSGARYEGMWANSLAHGRGRYTYPNGQVYEGEFTHGQMDDAIAQRNRADDLLVTETDN
eukprot:gene35512-46032_t